jgi:predicted transposase/invertase (TIGR01784 family)
MILGIDPKVDFAFKRVFGDPRNADILIHFLNAILRLPEPIVSIEIMNPFSDKDFSDDKLFPQVDDYHLVFGLYNLEHQIRFSDHLEIHVLECSKFTRGLHELRDEQDEWMYFLVHAEQMDPESLPEPFREPVYQRTTKELQMLTKDEVLRERYEARQMAIRDAISQLEEAREDGLEKGLEKGRQEGLERGALLERVRFSQQILNRPVTPAEELQALSIEQIRELADQLKSAVLDR